jgi:hypothetical protein
MRARYIKESPDEISIPSLKYRRGEAILNDERYSPTFTDDDAEAFTYVDGELVFSSEDPMFPGAKVHFERVPTEYPGRLWKDKKFISFWYYPPADTFKDMINQMERKLGKEIWNSDWYVEVLPQGEDWHDLDIIETKLIKPEEYTGSADQPDEYIEREHIKSPLKKKKTKKDGFGSVKYNTKKPLPYRMKFVSESLNESLTKNT